MMTNWTLKRRASFWIHAAIVTVPFSFSAISAWLFWYGLFKDGAIASSMIIVVDALALLGLILYIARIQSPFQTLRHALPFVSIVPLGIELYGVLVPNGALIAGTIAVLVTGIMVVVAMLCFRTIEQLFISPLDAAREKAQHDVAVLLLAHEQLQVVMRAVAVFRDGDTQALTDVAHAPLSAARPALAHSKPVNTDTLSVPVADGVCKYCKAEGLTATEKMRHGKAFKKNGVCK